MIQVKDNNITYTVRDIKVKKDNKNVSTSKNTIEIDGNQVFPTKEVSWYSEELNNEYKYRNYNYEIPSFNVMSDSTFTIEDQSNNNEIVILNENISGDLNGNIDIDFNDNKGEIQSINKNNVIFPDSAKTAFFNINNALQSLNGCLPGFLDSPWEYCTQSDKRFTIFILLNNKFNLKSISNMRLPYQADSLTEPTTNRLFIGCLNLDGNGNGVVQNKQGHTFGTNVGFFKNCTWRWSNKPTQIIFYNMNLESYIFVDASLYSSQFPNNESNSLELFIHNADKIEAYAFGEANDVFNTEYIKMWMTPGSKYEITGNSSVSSVEILEDGFSCKVFGKAKIWDEVPLNKAYFSDYYGVDGKQQFSRLMNATWEK